MPTSSTSTSPNTWAVRPAGADDAEAVEALLRELEHPAPLDVVRAQLARMAGLDTCRVLVALDGDEVIGMGTLHLQPLVHKAGPVGRITTMVVTERMQGRGVGKAMVDALEALTREAGGTSIEVTSNSRRDGAHAFYERLGYKMTSKRFVKSV